MKDICYLCGLPISHQELSNDHVIPKQLIKRKQSKTDPLKQPLFVSLSVFAKSAAALLVSRKLKSLPTQW